MLMSAGYTVAEVAKILDLAPEQVRAFVRQGLIEVVRGPRNEYRFTFRDLLLLRTARGLRDNDVPIRKVRVALQALRAQLPEDRPVSAVQVFAEGHEVVVQDADARWAPASGQMLFDFDVADLERKVRLLVPASSAPEAGDADRDLDAEGWLEVGLELELSQPDRARDAYRRALERSPQHLEARVRLARLLHDKGWLEAAGGHFDLALIIDPDSAEAHFNQGVLLEDLTRSDEAIEAYRRSIGLDPEGREAYLNLARLLERLGRKQEALQTLETFRSLLP